MIKQDGKQMNPDAAVRRGYLIEDYRVFHINSMEKEPIPPHFHGFHKLILVLSGDLQYIIEGMTCKVLPGKMLFVPAGSIHQPLIGEKNYERIVLWISTEAPELNGLEDAFQTAAEERLYLFSNEAVADRIRNIDEAEKEKGFGFVQLKSALLTEVLVNFAREVLEKSAETSEYKHISIHCGDLTDEMIVNVTDYIAGHLSEDLSAKALAKRFFVSESGLAGRFIRATGCSIHRYVLQKRLVFAARRIRIGIPAVRAAEEAGFTDYSTFYRAFTKYFEVSPKQFHT